jgi:hypothetical protein
MATRARLGKEAAAAVAGAEKMLLTPRKIFGGRQAAGAELDSEALPQSTGLRDEMKQERNELRNELRSEMQQWRSVIQNQMTLLENEQSKIKAQVIATITNMEKRDEQLQIEFK